MMRSHAYLALFLGLLVGGSALAQDTSHPDPNDPGGSQAKRAEKSVQSSGKYRKSDRATYDKKSDNPRKPDPDHPGGSQMTKKEADKSKGKHEDKY
jgi:hypothetical protein